LHIDPRYYQLVVQITLLLFGILQLQFEISPMRIAAVVAVAWLLQLFFTHLYQLTAISPVRQTALCRSCFCCARTSLVGCCLPF